MKYFADFEHAIMISSDSACGLGNCLTDASQSPSLSMWKQACLQCCFVLLKYLAIKNVRNTYCFGEDVCAYLFFGFNAELLSEARFK